MLSRDQIEQARNIDILQLASRHTPLKRIATTGGGEYAGPCPVCGGRDRFHIQAASNRWFCRNCTGTPEQDGWKDVIELEMRLKNASFSQAVQNLTDGTMTFSSREPLARPSISARNDEPPSDAWQKRGQAVVDRAQEALWGKAGSLAVEWQETDPATGETHLMRLSPRDWLADRGLTEETLQMAQIGYVPLNWGDNPANWGLDGPPVFFSKGIVIPCKAQDNLWSLKIRRPVGKPKYNQIRGGRPALYLADTLIASPEAVCITEGEFDALLLRQCLLQASNPRWRSLGVVTMGSNSNYLTLDRWARYLYPVKHFLLMYDQDGKSLPAVRFWENLSARTRQVLWRNLRPGDKDLTDYHRSGGRLLDLISWTIMQIEFDSQSRQKPGTPARLEYPSPAFPLAQPETEEKPLLDSPADHGTSPQPEPRFREVIIPIDELAEYKRVNDLHTKSVTWPRGAPRPLIEFE